MTFDNFPCTQQLFVSVRVCACLWSAVSRDDVVSCIWYFEDSRSLRGVTLQKIIIFLFTVTIISNLSRYSSDAVITMSAFHSAEGQDIHEAVIMPLGHFMSLEKKNGKISDHPSWLCVPLLWLTSQYYINTLHKNYTYVIRKRNLTASLLFQNLTTCFGPYGPSSGDIF
jgi:hypothetical protein